MSLQLGNGRLSVALQDRLNFHHRKVDLDLSAQSTEELNQQLHTIREWGSAYSVSCSITEPGNTLVPEAIYHEENLAHYHHFHLDAPRNANIASDKLIMLPAYNVYALPDGCELVTRVFPTCHILHESTVELELALRLARQANQNGAWLFFGNGFFRLILIQDGQLQLANTFRFASEMDVAYYVLYVFDQMHIDPKQFRTFATGNIDPAGAILTLLREYIGAVSLLSNSTLADTTWKGKNEQQALSGFTLLHQVLCAS